MNMFFLFLADAGNQTTYFKWKRKCKKKGKLKVYFLNIIEDQYETAIHLVVMIVIIVQIKTDAQKNYKKSEMQEARNSMANFPQEGGSTDWKLLSLFVKTRHRYAY